MRKWLRVRNRVFAAWIESVTLGPFFCTILFWYNKDMKVTKILVIVLGVIIIILLAVLIFYPSSAKGPTVPAPSGASSTAQSQ